jgi:transitional endoplasmic reticulum ATPase
MQPIFEFFLRLLVRISFFLCVIVPSLVILGMTIEFLSIWWRTDHALTFSVFSRMSREGTNAFTMLAILLISHAIEYLNVKWAVGQYGSSAMRNTVLSVSFYAVQSVSLFLYGGALLLWMLFVASAAFSSYVLPVSILVISGIGALWSRSDYAYGLTPQQRVRATHRSPASTSTPPKEESDEASWEDVARHQISKVTFADIMGNNDSKARLKEFGDAILKTPSGDAAKRNGILLFGEPGNGKTVFAEALAGELHLPILKLTHSDVASRWIGERTEKIVAAFNQAIQAAPCVLFIDEIDSFLTDRSSGAQQTKEDLDVTNSLLTLLVDIRRHKVVVMAATNYLDRLDAAAVREGRFDFKVEITAPDAAARVGLLINGLRKNLGSTQTEMDTIQRVAQRWNGFSAKRILAVTEEMPVYLAELKRAGGQNRTLQFDDFMTALRRIQGRKGVSPENVKPLSELILSESTKEALEMLSSQLSGIDELERLGGTLPTGVLFYGPPGTGKTVAAKALAKEADWAFLISSGTDLARDPKALDKLYAQAKELRPCIIFVDEADNLIRSRELSTHTEATDKLLTLMDGVNDRVRDVVWVAATNHPDQIDSALLRGGRFTEKVEFVRPDETQLTAHIARWLASRKVQISDGVSHADIAQWIGDQSVANVEAILQYAVNRAIAKLKARGVSEVCLTREDFLKGKDMVLGA